MEDRHLKRIGLLFTLLVMYFSCYALEFVSGSGNHVAYDSLNLRERHFYYHNNSDDQHWYGTNKWAVRFDFAAVYPTIANCQFNIQKAVVFFPAINDSVKIEFFSDLAGQPLSRLALINAYVNSPTMEFTIPHPISVSVVWMIVTYNTTQNGPYISASIGGGTKSFYWNTNAPTPYFQNMALAGYNSEFLFGVKGWFVFNHVDLELYSFNLTGDISPGRTVRPEFVIYNYSSQTISSAQIELTLSSPNPEYSVQDTIFIVRPLLPQSELVVTITTPEYLSYSYELPPYPSQVKVRAVLSSEANAADTLFNNTRTIYYESFADTLRVKPVENFLRFQQSENIWISQSDIENEVINYFPVINEPFYSAGVTNRFNWYGFSGLPMTVVGGNRNITGFSNFYITQLTAFVAELNDRKTFLSQSQVDLQLPNPPTEFWVQLTLRNHQTYMFYSSVDPSLVMQSRFFAALVKRENIGSTQRNIFKRWGAFADTIGTALNIDQTWTKQFSVSLQDITLDELNTNYLIIYWLQHQTSKKIIYANSFNLEEIVSADDPTAVPESRILLHPNPVKFGSDVFVKFPKFTASQVSLTIFNIKGQMVKREILYPKNSEIRIPSDSLPAKGIYLLNISTKDKSVSHSPKSKTFKLVVL